MSQKSTQKTTVSYSIFTSPLGDIWIGGDEAGISHINFPSQRAIANGPHRDHPLWQRCDGLFTEAHRQLSAYFAGELKTFDLPLNPQGTEFQRSVWNALLQVPFGQTCSYGDIANSIDKPKAVRAVGAANGRNPIPIVIPCHRVIGSSGKLTGYAGGLPLKEALLKLEGGLPDGLISQAELL